MPLSQPSEGWEQDIVTEDRTRGEKRREGDVQVLPSYVGSAMAETDGKIQTFYRLFESVRTSWPRSRKAEEKRTLVRDARVRESARRATARGRKTRPLRLVLHRTDSKMQPATAFDIQYFRTSISISSKI